MRKIILFTCLGIVIAGAIAVALLPSYLSTESGNRFLLSTFHRKILGTVHFSHVECSWLGPQKISDLTYKTDELSFSTPSILVDSSLFRLLLSQNVGKTAIERPSAEITTSSTLVSNGGMGVSLKEKHKAKPAKKKPAPQIPLSGTIIITDGSLLLSSSEKTPISLEKITAQLDISKEKGIFNLSTQGITRQLSSEGTFDIQGSLLLPLQEAFSLRTHCSIQSFPTEALAGIFQFIDPFYAALLQSGIGPTLDLSVDGVVSPSLCDLAMVIQSQNLKGQAQTILKDHQVSLKMPARLDVALDPSFFGNFISFTPPCPELKVDNTTTMSLVIEQIYLPFSNNRLDLDHMQGAARLFFSPFSISSSVEKIFQVDEASLSLESASLAKGIDYNATLRSGNQTSYARGNCVAGMGKPLEFHSTLHIEKLPMLLIQCASNTAAPLSSYFGSSIDFLDANVDYAAGEGKASGKLQTPALSIGEWDASLSERKWNVEKSIAIEYRPSQKPPVHGSINPFAATLSDNGNISLLTPLKITTELSVDNLHSLLYQDSATKILQPVQCTATLSPFDKAQGLFKGDIRFSEIVFFTPLLPQQASVEGAHLHFVHNEAKQRSTVEMQMQAKQAQATLGNFISAITIDGLSAFSAIDWDALKMQGSMQCADFSTAVLESLIAPQSSLNALLGSTFSLDARLSSTAKEQFFSLLATSENVHADIQFRSDEKALTVQNSKGSLDLKITPQSYPYFDRILLRRAAIGTPFDLLQPSVWSISIKQLNLPLTYDSSRTGLNKRFPISIAGWQEIAANANVQIAQMQLRNKISLQVATLSSLQAAIEKKKGPSPLSFHVHGDVSAKSSGSHSIEKRGALAGEALLSELFDEKGSLNLLNSQIALNATIQQFPSCLLDVFLRTSGNPEPLFSIFFGDTLNAQCDTQLRNSNGTLKMHVQSNNAKAALDARIDNGVLKLNQDFDAQMSVTPELSDFAFSKVNPLSISGISAKNPVTVHIEAQGFSIPLSSYDPSLVQIGKGTIECGQIVCHNEGNINIALGLLKIARGEKDIQLWFAPIDFAIQSGKAQIERTEILIANTYDVALWGDINFAQDKVDMVLGLTADCLKAAFGIKGLPENYVLQIPMKGHMNNVKINTTKATAKITALLAWQQKALGGWLGGGGTGAILGEILGNLATLPDSNSKTPPAKHPFPWEIETKKKKTSHHTRKKTIKRTDKPLKQLLKILR